jgi:hypothetical protein
MKPVHAGEMASAAPVDGRGHGRTPRVQLMLDERDRYLREAAKFFPGCSNHEVAAQLHTKLSNYRGGRFRRERVDLTCPVEHKGKLVQTLWCLLKSYDAVPAARTIRRVLAAPTRGQTFEV